jgi:hypothetical protein
MTTDPTITVDVGRERSGRMLDGRTHEGETNQ